MKNQPKAWMTHHDEPMLFPTEAEAQSYCDDDEQPIPLYEAPVSAEPVGVPKCPFHCGWDGLHKIAVQDAAYLAKVQWPEDEEGVSVPRATAMRSIDYLIQVCRTMLNAAPVAAQAQQPVSGADRLPVKGDPWSGWACQHPGKLPRLYGDKAIAELNHHPEEGDRLFQLAECTQQDADKVDAALAEMVHAMFRSGNSVPVTRITIDRKQYDAAIDAARKEPGQ